MMYHEVQIPETYRGDIHKAVKILKEAGCANIYLFGSLATGQMNESSDIDLAVRGCPPGEFFHLLGQLLLELEHPVDLVSMDKPDLFTDYLEKEGELISIG